MMLDQRINNMDFNLKLKLVRKLMRMERNDEAQEETKKN